MPNKVIHCALPVVAQLGKVEIASGVIDTILDDTGPLSGLLKAHSKRIHSRSFGVFSLETYIEVADLLWVDECA